MKRILFILLCLVCAAAGLGIGRYVWAAPVSDAPVIGSSNQPSTNATPTQNAQQAITALRSGPRRAALILAMSARGERNKLPALIAACQNDEVALRFLADAWLRIDPGAFVRAMASSEAMQGSRPEAMYLVLTDIISRWGETDPDAAWRGAMNLPRNLSQWLLNQLTLDRIARDPKAGLEFVLRHPGQTLSFSGAKMENAAELLPLIRQLPDCAGKQRTLTAALKGLPVTEAMAALGESTEYSVMVARYAVLRNAAKADVNEVIAWHAQATGRARSTAAQTIGDALLTNDPAAALEWAQEHLSGFSRTHTIRKAAEALASKDPAAAAAARALLPENFKPKPPGK